MSSKSMNPIQRVIARRMVGQKLADESQIALRQAIREFDSVAHRATAAILAAAVGCPEAIFRDGMLAESAVAGIVTFAGVAMPVGAIGDGQFLEWLFSDAGREAILKWVETIVKIIAILGPLFL